MNIKNALVLATTTISLGYLAPNAQAALITGVTASTTIPSGFNDINNTVNGRGLPGNTPSLTGNHASPILGIGGNAWASSFPSLTGNITFNLQKQYELQGFSFWNLFSSFQSSGIKNVDIFTSTDGVNFTPLPGAPTQFKIGSALPAISEAPEIFSFLPVVASYVQFQVKTNYGSITSTGFAEVQFNSKSVPEPASILGLIMVGGSLLAIRQRT